MIFRQCFKKMFIKFLFLDFSSIRSKGVIKFPINKDKKLECKKNVDEKNLDKKRFDYEKFWVTKILDTE